MLKLKVLFCEDDEATHLFIVKRFIGLGCEVFSAYDGEEGLEKYKEHKPDLIITDLNMPLKDGLELIFDIRKEDRKVPIVVISAFSDNEKLLECIEQNVTHYIIKPINISKITEIIKEIQERVKIQRDAIRHEKNLTEYKKAFDKGSIVSITDVNGVITYVNDAFCDVTGFSREELLGQNHNIVRHPNMPKEEFKRLWKTILRKEVFQGVIESRTKSGSSYITDTTIVPIIDENNDIEEFVAIRHNLASITDAYERNIKTIIENDEALIVVFNEFYEPMIANEAFEEVFGSVEENTLEICNKIAIEDSEEDIFFDDGSKKDVKDKFLNLIYFIKFKSQNQCKVTVKSDNLDSDKIFMVKVSSIQNELIRQRSYHMVSFLDITEIEKMRDEEGQKSKLAYIGQLSASITHEINTPLTYIKGNLELLEFDVEEIQDKELKERIGETISTMEGGVTRIASIVDTMRETTGVSEDKEQECNLYETLVYSCRMIFSRSKHISPIYINDRPFTLKLDKEKENFPATIFPQKMEQVWVIIMNNALDELKESSISFKDRYIKINIEEINGKIEITFKDNGGGIPEKIVDKIFDSFVSTKKSESSGGMGLGLNIAKTIVSSNHGIISAHNEDGGAVFKITL